MTTQTAAPIEPAAREHEVRCHRCGARTANITGYCPDHPEERAAAARRWADTADLSTRRRAELIAGCLDVN